MIVATSPSIHDRYKGTKKTGPSISPEVCSRLAILTLIALLTSPTALIARQVDHASALRSSSAADRSSAARALLKIPTAEHSPRVLPALVAALDDYSDERDERWAILDGGGTPIPRSDHGEYVFTLLTLTIRYQDPSTISALLPFLDTGNGVINALAAFGDRSVLEIADRAAGLSTRRGIVDGAILALHRMLLGDAGGPLSASSMARIRALAERLLSGPQDPFVAASAIDLALATGDAGLRDRVQAFVDDESAIRVGLGISDGEFVEFVRARADSGLRRQGG